MPRTGAPAAGEALLAVRRLQQQRCAALQLRERAARRRRQPRHEARRQDLVDNGAADEEREQARRVWHIEHEVIKVFQHRDKALSVHAHLSASRSQLARVLPGQLAAHVAAVACGARISLEKCMQA